MYQTGGAVQGSILQEIAKLPQDQQKQIMTAFGKWAQSKGLNLQQLQGNEQVLEQALTQFLQEMQGAQKARLGAKLNYIRSLKGNAPEGMDIEYYKCGGQVKKKFIKKNACGSKGMAAVKAFKDKCGSKMKKKSCKEFGGEIQSDKCGSKMKKKSCKEFGGNIESDKCGGKAKKHQYGGSLNQIPFYQRGTSKGGIKRFSVSHLNGSGTKYFDTEEQARAYQKTQKQGTTVRRDSKEESSGKVLRADRTKEKSTQYGRQKLETWNNLPFKQAYQEARKTGNKYFAYKGKVYKTDLNNGKDNMTTMMQHYGNYLGYSKDPKLQTKTSRNARSQYRKDIKTSEVGYTTKKKKVEVPYSSAYDGGELFSNFVGLTSPSRWVGALGRSLRGKGNSSTFIGRMFNNMLDPDNGARANQGIFSTLSPTDEQWAANHPTVTAITNGVMDMAAFGPKPKVYKDFKFKPKYGYTGRQYVTTKQNIPMEVYDGTLNISPWGKPYIEQGEKVGDIIKTVNTRQIINPGTRYVKSVSTVPTGPYKPTVTDGMTTMYPWVVANTANNIE